MLGRDGRMIAAIEAIGPGAAAYEGDPVPARSRIALAVAAIRRAVSC